MAGRDPRFELLTPRGAGGVAVVAVRGSDRWARVSPFLAAGTAPPTDRPCLCVLELDAAVADQVLLVDRPAAGVLEIHLHGSPAVLREFEHAVGGFGGSEQPRGSALLCGARSREQLALALEQRVLDLDRFLAAASPAELSAALQRSRAALAHSQPRRLVICGDQNAGKSTLMNRLLFRERVVTGALPGLTRDPVAEGTLLDGYPYELIDTAGEGDVADEVDRRALDLARHARRDGLLLLVVDGSRDPSPSDRAIRNDHTLVVRSKSDLPPAAWPGDFAPGVTLSCRDDADAGNIRQAVGRALRQLRALPRAGPVGGLAALDVEELDRLRSAHEQAAP